MPAINPNFTDTFSNSSVEAFWRIRAGAWEETTSIGATDTDVGGGGYAILEYAPVSYGAFDMTVVHDGGPGLHFAFFCGQPGALFTGYVVTDDGVAVTLQRFVNGASVANVGSVESDNTYVRVISDGAGNIFVETSNESNVFIDATYTTGTLGLMLNDFLPTFVRITVTGDAAA